MIGAHDTEVYIVPDFNFDFVLLYTGTTLFLSTSGLYQSLLLLHIHVRTLYLIFYDICHNLVVHSTYIL